MTIKIMHKGNVVRLPVDQIEVGTRLRKVNAGEVKKLMLMAEESGITAPIHVRKVKTRYVLIDGAHRLEAVKQMGGTEIAALVFECRADEAKIMEASNNLAAAKMSPLHSAVFIASWERAYYKLHPERKGRSFRGNQYTGKLVTEIDFLSQSIAMTFGVTRRQAHNILRMARTLSSTEIDRLESAPRLTAKDILEIGKIADKKERAAVVEKLSAGEAKSTKDALTAVRPQVVEANNTISAVEQQYSAMQTAFSRANKTARRRFIQDNAKVLRALLDDLAV